MDAGKTLITLRNYDEYQRGAAAQDAAGTQRGRNEDALKEQENNSAKAGEPAAVIFGAIRESERAAFEKLTDGRFVLLAAARSEIGPHNNQATLFADFTRVAAG